jgi:hypothetical protein
MTVKDFAVNMDFALEALGPSPASRLSGSLARTPARGRYSALAGPGDCGRLRRKRRR